MSKLRRRLPSDGASPTRRTSRDCCTRLWIARERPVEPNLCPLAVYGNAVFRPEPRLSPAHIALWVCMQPALSCRAEAFNVIPPSAFGRMELPAVIPIECGEPGVHPLPSTE